MATKLKDYKFWFIHREDDVHIDSTYGFKNNTKSQLTNLLQATQG